MVGGETGSAAARVVKAALHAHRLGLFDETLASMVLAVFGVPTVFGQRTFVVARRIVALWGRRRGLTGFSDTRVARIASRVSRVVEVDMASAAYLIRGELLRGAIAQVRMYATELGSVDTVSATRVVISVDGGAVNTFGFLERRHGCRSRRGCISVHLHYMLHD
jgi:hypothetical protein